MSALWAWAPQAAIAIVMQAGKPMGEEPARTRRGGGRWRGRQRHHRRQRRPPPPHTHTHVAAAVSCAVYTMSLRLSRWASPRASMSYSKLPRAEQVAWDGRAPSTAHAVVIVAAAAYLAVGTDVFAEQEQQATPFMLRTSQLSTASLGFSLGYFVTDLLHLAAHYPSFGGPDIAVHHAAALASVGAAALQGHAHGYTLALLFTVRGGVCLARLTAHAPPALVGAPRPPPPLPPPCAQELTTPFVNARWLLDKCGLRCSSDACGCEGCACASPRRLDLAAERTRAT